MQICVYCASSRACDPDYHAQGHRLGELIAEGGHDIIYGGGAVGTMGAVADGALSKGGTVRGVLPQFMLELEWGHPNLSTLDIVEDMRERKHRMLTASDAVVALPGGTGTLEELFEALTLKRLGLYLGPIILVNTKGYFEHFTAFMAHCIGERFMDTRHGDMWVVVDNASQVLEAIEAAPKWTEEARGFAAIGGEGLPIYDPESLDTSTQ